MVRTLGSALEARWGVKIKVDSVLWPWVAEFAGWLLTRAQVGADG